MDRGITPTRQLDFSIRMLAFTILEWWWIDFSDYVGQASFLELLCPSQHFAPSDSSFFTAVSLCTAEEDICYDPFNRKPGVRRGKTMSTTKLVAKLKFQQTSAACPELAT